MAKLVIVESPSKIKSVKKYLGTGYNVMASKGHVRDLPKSKLGVDVENNFKPDYVTIKGKKKTIDELKNNNITYYYINKLIKDNYIKRINTGIYGK